MKQSQPDRAALLVNRLEPILRMIAAESGETAEQLTFRLLSYGIEVHNDLVAGGENPRLLPR